MTGDTTAAQLPGERWAAAVARRVRAIAAQRSLWPGFNPSDVPLALFDGKRTYLFGHPAPPEGFGTASADGLPVHVYEGRHEAIIANTGIELGGVMTATLMRDGGLWDRPVDDAAAIAVHEAFHVYQSRKPQIWKFANEADRFLYPLTDVDVMAQRLMEIRALRRALQAESLDQRLGWAKRAIRARRERFAAMAPALAEYERRTEMIEGLAAYVEAAAAGRTDVPALLDTHVADVRRTCYGTGHALGLLLDAADPRWKEELEQGFLSSLDEALEAALDDTGNLFVPDFPAEEREELLRQARDQVRHVEEERSRKVATFASRAGRRLIVEGKGGELLWVRGFDPSNAHLAGGALGVIHTRALMLQAGENRIEILKERDVAVEALTEGAGPNPLFDGIKRVEVVAGGGAWHVRAGAGTLRIEGAGLKAELRPVDWSDDGDRVIVRIGG